MNPTDIYQKIEESYQNNRQRLIEFFQNHSYDEQQAEELSESMKVAVFFLETHAYDRHDLDIEMRKELKAPIKKEIEALKNAKPTMEQLDALESEATALEQAEADADAQKVTDKVNAKAKLIAGEALTEAEADTIVI